MRSPGRHGRFPLLACSLALTGCGKQPAVTYQTYFTPAPSVAPSADSSNAFDRYVLAASEAEKAAPTYLTRVSFTPEMRKRAAAQARSAVQKVRAATALTCEFRYVGRKPFEPARHLEGWRLIQRVLVWNIEDACASGDYDAAISEAVVATKWGFDLTGGSVMDASLGLSIIDSARKALTPHLRLMGAEQLKRLSDGIAASLTRMAPFDQTLANEKSNMLAAVQLVQDLCREGKLESLQKDLGNDVRDAVHYLRDLPEQERPKYFAGFVAEAEEEIRWVHEMSSRTPAEREQAEGPKLAESRPWRRFSKHFFQTPRRFLPLRDATVARTRLLVLTSAILQQVKATGQAPADLSAFPKDLVLDPFTNQPFMYRAAGPEMKIYSLGLDGIDNAGETDSVFASPDLTIETTSL